jgi:hypothetical protein
MQTINWNRVLTGGLLAGLVINLFEFLANGVLLARQWEAAMQALGRPPAVSGGQIAAFNIWGFLVGIVAMWLYAAMRPRYGAGPGTALRAAVAVWVLGYFLSAAAPVITGILPMGLMGIGIAVGLVEVILGTLLGARTYQEAAAPAAASAAGR